MEPRSWMMARWLRWGPATAQLRLVGQLGSPGRALPVDLECEARRAGRRVYGLRGSGRVGGVACTSSAQLAWWGAEPPELAIWLRWAEHDTVTALRWGELPWSPLPAGAEFRGWMRGLDEPAILTLRLDYRTLMLRTSDHPFSVRLLRKTFARANKAGME